MAKDNINFYENFDWKSLKSSDLEEKIQQILKMMNFNFNFHINCMMWQAYLINSILLFHQKSPTG